MAILVDLVGTLQAQDGVHLCVCVCVYVLSLLPMLMLIFYSICIKFAKLLLLLLHKSYLFRKLLFHVRLSGSRSGSSVACKNAAKRCSHLKCKLH